MVSLPYRCRAKGTPPEPHHDHPWTLRCTPGNTLMLPIPADEREDNSKTVVVVPVFGGIPVAIRRTQIPRFVVPRTTTQGARESAVFQGPNSSGTDADCDDGYRWLRSGIPIRRAQSFVCGRPAGTSDCGETAPMWALTTG